MAGKQRDIDAGRKGNRADRGCKLRIERKDRRHELRREGRGK
jgi:hypothetical protein